MVGGKLAFEVDGQSADSLLLAVVDPDAHSHVVHSHARDGRVDGGRELVAEQGVEHFPHQLVEMKRAVETR